MGLDPIHTTIVVVGVVLILIYLFFFADTRLTPGEADAFYYVFGFLPIGHKGSRWGLIVLFLAVIFLVVGIWPLIKF